MKKYFFSILITMVLAGCIGTDLIDAELVDEVILVTPEEASLLVGEQLMLEANYFDMFGVLSDATLSWQVDDSSIATVDETGKVIAISSGQAHINAKFGEVISNGVQITVVEDAIEIAKVSITEPDKTRIAPEETLQLTAEALNINDNTIDGKTITWSSSDPALATVDSDGLVKGVANGEVEITASSEGINSLPLALTVAGASAAKMATFSGAGSYTVKGTATLKFDENEDLILDLSQDFETSSFGVAIFIYLSNTTDGTSTKANGLELQEITTNGAKSFNVSDKNASAGLDTYQYVIVLCKPVGITFGLADFQN